MLRLILFLFVLAVLAWAGVWVADNPGQVRLNWGGWQMDTSAGVLAVLVAAVAILASILYRMWLFLTRAPGQISAAMKGRRSQKGYLALTKGMVAVAAGDAREAKRQVGKADGLLGNPPLTLLLKAQAAQLNGDESAAEAFFKIMLEEPEMEFLGLRGLLNQATKAGNQEQALTYAKRALKLMPKSEGMAEQVFHLEAQSGHWAEAGAALGQADKFSTLSKTDTGHRQAVALLAQSIEVAKSDTIDGSKAQKLAEKALAQDPTFVPAAVQVALHHLKNNKLRKAKSVIEKTWGTTPHPALVELYFQALKADTPLKKVKAAEALWALDKTATGHVTVAKASLDAQLWGQARTHLDAALTAGMHTRAVYTLLAQLEEQDRGDKEQAAAMYARASTAAADPAWVCGTCGHVDLVWQPHCTACHGFDTARWKSPAGSNLSKVVEESEILKIEKQTPKSVDVQVTEA